MRFRIEYLLLLGFSRIVCRLRLSTALGVGRILGRVVFSVVRYRRDVAFGNLQRALGREKNPGEIRRIAREVYRHFGQLVVEWCRFPVLRAADIESRITMIHDDLLKEIEANGRGAMMISGHFGNWEMMGAAVAHFGRPFRVLVARQKNRFVGDLMDRFRRTVGVLPTRVGLSVKEVLWALRRGEFVGILSDQNAGRGGVFVEFFGRPTSTPRGPAAIALKTGVPVILCFAIREPRGHYRVVFERLENGRPFPTGTEGVQAITQIYTQRLEAYIRQYPEQWLWTHRRWKCLPPVEERVVRSA